MRAAAFISLLWAGTLIGTSFLATPAKFLVSSLSLSQALEIGRATFNVLGFVEYTLILLLSLTIYKLLVNKLVSAIFGILLLLVLVQQVLVLPQLDVRTNNIINGGIPTPSSLHSIYMITEALKTLFLFCLAFLLSKKS